MPRIAILSDIHANLPALEKVLEKLEKESPDIWLCLGDLVGYGPYPSECIDLVRERNMICVKGNHDAGVTGELTVKHFRNPNRKLIEITNQRLLRNDQVEWLKSLPYIVEDEHWIAAHASPIEPEKWQYIESAFTARDILKKTQKQFCFIGHTHKPVLVSEGFGINKVKPGHSYLINPGSVGQSRDGDYRGACGILDTNIMEYKTFRIDFDIEKVLTGLTKLGFSRKEASQMIKI